MDKNKLLELMESANLDTELKKRFSDILVELLDLRKNNFHPFVFINGEPEFGKNVYIGLFSEINARKGKVVIGDNCDIASFVSINVADSHRMTIGIAADIVRGSIVLEQNVFVGSHSFIGGDTVIGHNSVVAAGTILINGGVIPPFSLIVGNPAVIKPGYYNKNADPT